MQPNPTPRQCRPALPLVLAVLAIAGAGGVDAATFTVTSAADAGPGSLRQAIVQAHAAPGPHLIEFDLPAGSTITLASTLVVDGPTLVIRGPGSDALAISGNNAVRHFDLPAGDLTLQGMTLRDARVVASSDPLERAGAAIRATVYTGLDCDDVDDPPDLRHLTLVDVAIVDNTIISTMANLGSAGGAVAFSGGRLTVHDSRFENNSADAAGGAIFAYNGRLRIDNTVIADNRVESTSNREFIEGGGVFALCMDGQINGSRIVDNQMRNGPGGSTIVAEGIGLVWYPDAPGGGRTLRIVNSEIAGNTTSIPVSAQGGSLGGGILCDSLPDTSGLLSLVNSTVSGNRAEFGGGIASACPVSLQGSTIAGNTSANETGFGSPGIELGSGAAVLSLSATLVANNTGGPDLVFFGAPGDNPSYGAVDASLIRSIDGSALPAPAGVLTGVDPQLGPLTDNGGRVRTHALLAGSPAIDAGIDPAGIATDGRGAGFGRIAGARADIGAFEAAAAGGSPSRDHTGVWYQPDEDGRGLSLNAFGDTLFGLWFVYDEFGRAQWYQLDPQWTGPDVTSGRVVRWTGTPWGPTYDPQARELTEVGRFTLRFESEARAAFAYDVDGVNRSIGLDRISADPAAAAPPSLAMPSRDYTGVWFQPAENGRGLSLNVFGDILFGLWFVYDQDGRGSWYQLDPAWTGPDLASGRVVRWTGTPWGPDYDPDARELVEAGNFSLSFTGENAAMLTYDVDGVSRSVALQRIIE
jgi:hypothetical protein